MLKKAAVLVALAALFGCESDGDNDVEIDRQDRGGTISQDENRNDRQRSDRASKLDAADREFLEDAAAAGMFEVQSSQLAITRATDDMKTFAEKMVDEHNKANTRLMDLAATPPRSLCEGQ